MIAVFDASVLVFFLDGRANAPIDRGTGRPLEGCKDRVDHLIDMLQEREARIVVPTPVLAELLVKAGEAGPDWLRILSSRKFFRITDFDVRAAVEFAEMQNEKTRSGAGKQTATRAKAKFDDQIVAIARVEGAGVIYSDDKDIVVLASGSIKVIGVSELTLPLESPQLKLNLPDREES